MEDLEQGRRVGSDLGWTVVLAPVLSLTKEKRTEEEVSEKVG